MPQNILYFQALGMHLWSFLKRISKDFRPNWLSFTQILNYYNNRLLPVQPQVLCVDPYADEQNLYFDNFFYDKCTYSKVSIYKY